MKRVLLAATLAFTPCAADAGFCDRPTPPSCLGLLGLENEFSFEMCRTEMVRYQSDAQAFVECSRREQNEVVEELNVAIRKFNACARDKYC